MANKDILKKEIGVRVKEIRENKMHMTKVQFANLIGMKNQYLGTVENGQRGLTVEKVVEICKKTNTSCDFLLCGVNNSFEINIKKISDTYGSAEVCRAFDILKDFVQNI